MSRIIRSSRFWLLGAIALAAFAGTAYATIPAGDGTIHGCYAKSGGTLRVIDGSVTTCKSGETALDWSKTGLPGPKGDPGAAGPAGPQGEQGEPGAPGGLAGYEIVTSLSDFTSDDKFRVVLCPAGKVAIGGGASLQGNFSRRVALDHSEPLANGLGWHAQASQIVASASTWAIGVKAICADAA